MSCHLDELRIRDIVMLYLKAGLSDLQKSERHVGVECEDLGVTQLKSLDLSELHLTCL